MLRHVPPVAVPVRIGDLWRGFTAAFRPQDAQAHLQSALAEKTGSPNCFLVSSGRAALTVIFLALKRLSRRSRVVVPAYTCPTVVQSVLEAGLEPVFCDVSPHTLDLDRDALAALDKSDLLAVVPTHLYGLAHDVADLLAMGRENGFLVIEDAAQAFGATFGSRMVGTRGDAGFYSLGRGKCIPAGHGGAIVVQDQHAPAFSGLLDELLLSPLPPEEGRHERSEGRSAMSVSKGNTHFSLLPLVLFAGYGVATHPRGWWCISHSRLNPADAGMNADAMPPIRVQRISATAAGIASSILARYGQIAKIQRRNARQLLDLLGGFRFAEFPEILPGAEPVFLRLPLVVDGQARADQLFRALSREGIGVSRSYWRSLPDLYARRLPVGNRGFPGASRLATCLLTLPTNAFVRPRDLARVVRAFERAA